MSSTKENRLSDSHLLIIQLSFFDPVVSLDFEAKGNYRYLVLLLLSKKKRVQCVQATLSLMHIHYKSVNLSAAFLCCVNGSFCV